jgi:hypothetical protein
MPGLTFISYSHEDDDWLRELRIMLDPVNQQISTWADEDIAPGTKWRAAIEDALRNARVAVLLVSKHFLASTFIRENELPPLLTAAAEGGTVILWVYVSACMYKVTPIAEYQAAHDVSKPLNLLSRPKRDIVLVEVAERILAAHNGMARLGPEMMPPRDPGSILPTASRG